MYAEKEENVHCTGFIRLGELIRYSEHSIRSLT